MKSIFFGLLILVASQFAQARALDTDANARLVKSQIEGKVMATEGVNGIGIGGCDPMTGKESDFKSDFVYCVQIFTETQQAEQVVRQYFPAGKKFRGVFVTTETIGEIKPQPRFSVGNG